MFIALLNLSKTTNGFIVRPETHITVLFTGTSHRVLFYSISDLQIYRSNEIA